MRISSFTFCQTTVTGLAFHLATVEQWPSLGFSSTLWITKIERLPCCSEKGLEDRLGKLAVVLTVVLVLVGAHDFAVALGVSATAFGDQGGHDVAELVFRHELRQVG